jgi:hypothetical protein
MVTVVKSFSPVEVFANEVYSSFEVIVIFNGVPNRKSVSVWPEAGVRGVAAGVCDVHHHLIKSCIFIDELFHE